MSQFPLIPALWRISKRIGGLFLQADYNDGFTVLITIHASNLLARYFF